jgi:F-type H+-transporting ATPase subunit a
MRLLFSVPMSISPTPLFAEALTPAAPAATEGLTKYPVHIFSIGGFPITNSMISEFIVTIIIIAVIQTAMRAPKLVPSGMQNFIEWIVESMTNFLEMLMGRETTRRGFWYFGGLIIFIVVGNVLALVPGVGTIGFGHGTNIWNFEVTKPFFRGTNANDNLTAAYSAIFFFMFFYWCYRAAGVGGSLFHIFGPKVRFKNPFADGLFILIFFTVGWVELLTILFVRPIAFTFRLYGNIFGGEYLLDSIYKMAPHIAFLTLVPFYFYELLVAVVQAFVFFVLTAAFTGLITNTSNHPAEDH